LISSVDFIKLIRVLGASLILPARSIAKPPATAMIDIINEVRLISPVINCAILKIPTPIVININAIPNACVPMLM